jgi:hypothetical protein
MSRTLPILAATTLALSACGTAAPEPNASENVARSGEASTSASAAPACAPVKLDLTRDRFDEGRANFAEGRAARERLAANFAKAEACAAGWLARKPLIDPRAESKDTLFLANAPQANGASIYFNDVAMIMEGPFVDGAGNVQVPGAGAIKEAIYCHAVGATEQEQVENGRCLVD